MRVTGFDHPVLITADVARSLRFYAEGARSGDRAGTDVAHFCCVIDPTDLDALAADDVIDAVSGPTDGLFGAQGFARSPYMRDPDDNVIDLRSY